MEKQINDTESVNSSKNSSTDSSTERLKVPTGAKCKVWKFVTNEAGVIVSKTHVLLVNMTSAFVETQQI